LVVLIQDKIVWILVKHVTRRHMKIQKICNSDLLHNKVDIGIFNTNWTKVL